MEPCTTAATASLENEIMRDTRSRFEKPTPRGFAATLASAMCALLLAGHAPTSLARQAPAQTFPSAEEAGNALYRAVQGRDEAAITAILGAGKELVSSNDRVQDRRDRQRFIRKYQQMHRLVREPDASTVLYIGAENWPFPIPLTAENGSWHFDAKRGMEEVLYRRIGENELSATQACHVLALAQGEQARPERETSMQALRALPGSAARHGGGDVAFHGYYFRVLAGHAKHAATGVSSRTSGRNASGGFAFVAYPAAYGSTGVMTYVVDRNDVVYAKDLGPNSGSIAKGMTEYDPDSTWRRDE